MSLLAYRFMCGKCNAPANHLGSRTCVLKGIRIKVCAKCAQQKEAK